MFLVLFSINFDLQFVSANCDRGIYAEVKTRGVNLHLEFEIERLFVILKEAKVIFSETYGKRDDFRRIK